MKITVSIPHRGRNHDTLPAVVNTFLELAEDPKNVSIVVSTDDDDAPFEYEREGLIVSRAPREDCLGDKWNRALKVSPADIYMMGADDVCVLSKGWDKALRDGARLFPDGIGVLYFGEAPGASLPLGQAVTHGWADAFGGVYPSHFPYWFGDMWLDELALMTGRMIWVDMLIGSLDKDGRGKTRGLRDIRFWNQFFDITRPIREHQADQAIAELYKDQPYQAWRLKGKGRLAMRQMFEGRSKYIHDTAVEAEKNQSIDAPEDDRYVRVKRNAELYLESLYKQAA